MERQLMHIYKILLKNFGCQKWWPAKSEIKATRQLEICIGAILTQNTAWKNAEKALENLRNENLLNQNSLINIAERKLALLIKPAGYYNQKAKKLKAFANFLRENNLARLEKMPAKEARELLLEVHGIGNETANSILLYALNNPFFVVDAYTRRIFERLFNLNPKNYDELQEFFMENLQHNVQLFNEYHALLVRLAKEFCKKKPECGKCPLRLSCQFKQKMDAPLP